MEKTVVEDPVCAACGAEVRPDTQYCYNCGAAIFEGSADEPSAKDSAPEDVKLSNGSGTKEVLPGSMPRLETAAAMRQRPKLSQRKTVEIVWEKPDGGASSTFIIVSLALLFFSIAAVVLSLYFR